MGMKTGGIVLQLQGEVFSSIQMTAWPVLTAELFLARDHSVSAVYQVVCDRVGWFSKLVHSKPGCCFGNGRKPKSLAETSRV